MAKVIYISGYGRSGSTILDVVLGGHPEIVSVGELTYFMEELLTPGRRCACGDEYVDCAFWGDVGDRVAITEEAKSLVRTVEARRSLSRLWTRTLGDARLERYREFQKSLVEYACSRSGTDILVDSSKSGRHAAGRPWGLATLEDVDLYVLHLVRDGRSTMEAVVKKGSNPALEGFKDERSLRGLRTTFGWTIGNTIGWLAGHRAGRHGYMRVRYEDLIRDPAETLRKIGRHVSVEMSELVTRIEASDGFSVGHNVGGNRVRKEEKLTLRRDPTATVREWPGLRWYHRGAFALVGGWLNRLLGY